MVKYLRSDRLKPASLFRTVIRAVTQRLGKKRCVMTLTAAAKETKEDLLL